MAVLQPILLVSATDLIALITLSVHIVRMELMTSTVLLLFTKLIAMTAVIALIEPTTAISTAI